MKKACLVFLVLVFSVFSINVDFYYSSFCPHCHKVLESGILEKIKTEYPNITVNKYCVDNEETTKKMIEIQRYYNTHYNSGIFVGGVPFVVVYKEDWRNGDVIQGDTPIIENLEPVLSKYVNIEKNLSNSTSNVNTTTVNNTKYTSNSNNTSISENVSNINSKINNSKISVNDLIGKLIFTITLLNNYEKNNLTNNRTIISLNYEKNKKTNNSKISANDPIGKLIFTITLGAADSINPCIMAILTLLIATLSKSDPKKAVKYAIVFILVVFLSYFIIGLMLYLGMYIIITKFAYSWGKYIIGLSCLLLLIVGLINLKEFFFFGRGISLKLPDRYVKTVKDLINEGTTLSIIILGGLITIVEFPCSGVMYLGFSSAFAAIKATIYEYLIYLFIYNIIFVMPLIIITYGYMKFNDVDRFKKFRLKYRKIFRLIMGLVMIGLSIWMYFYYFK